MTKQTSIPRITNRIVAELEKGTRPWLKPWNAEHTVGRITAVAYIEALGKNPGKSDKTSVLVTPVKGSLP